MTESPLQAAKRAAWAEDCVVVTRSQFSALMSEIGITVEEDPKNFDLICKRSPPAAPLTADELYWLERNHAGHLSCDQARLIANLRSAGAEVERLRAECDSLFRQAIDLSSRGA